MGQIGSALVNLALLVRDQPKQFRPLVTQRADDVGLHGSESRLTNHSQGMKNGQRRMKKGHPRLAIRAILFAIMPPLDGSEAGWQTDGVKINPLLT